MYIGCMRALTYTRVSTSEQADSGAGLAAQVASVGGTVERRGWVHVAELSDEGVSGSVAPEARRGLGRALKMLDGGEADVLVVAKLDRLSRSVVDLSLLLDRAERSQWSLVVLDADVDTTTAGGRLVANVLGAVAEWERRIVAERTRAALAARKAQGVRLGGPITLAAETRNTIVALRADGMTLQAIADRLTAHGVPTARGGRWRPSSVRAVLVSLDLDAQAIALAKVG